MDVTLESLAKRVDEIERTLEQLTESHSAETDANRQAFLKESESLLRQYPNEFVAYIDGRFVGHDSDRDRLLDRLYAEFPGKRVFYKQLLPATPVYRAPSPHLA
jgi:hypothetical protein